MFNNPKLSALFFIYYSKYLTFPLSLEAQNVLIRGMEQDPKNSLKEAPNFMPYITDEKMAGEGVKLLEAALKAYPSDGLVYAENLRSVLPPDKHHLLLYKGNDPNEEWEIRVRAYNLPGAANAKHLALSLHGPDGHLIQELNGMSVHRTTKKFGTAEVFEENDTIQVISSYTPFNQGFFDQGLFGPAVGASPVSDHELDKESVLFKGTYEEVMAKLILAQRAALIINLRNMDYVATGGLLTPGQNSNSVISTLVQSMGLKMPEDIASLWAPGSGRTLLPPAIMDHIAQQIINSPPDVLRYIITKNIDFLKEGSVKGNINSTPEMSEEGKGLIDPNDPEENERIITYIIPVSDEAASPRPEQRSDMPEAPDGLYTDAFNQQASLSPPPMTTQAVPLPQVAQSEIAVSFLNSALGPTPPVEQQAVEEPIAKIVPRMPPSPVPT